MVAGFTGRAVDTWKYLLREKCQILVERSVLDSEICLLYSSTPSTQDPRVYVKKSIELLQISDDTTSFYSFAFPGNIIAPYAAIYLNEGVIGNFPMEVLACLLFHRDRLDERALVVAMAEVSDDFVGRVISAAKSANVEAAGRLFNRGVVVSEIFQVAVVLLLALTRRVPLETLKMLGAVYGIPALVEGAAIGNFFHQLVQRELKSEYANCSASEIATLVFSMRPTISVSQTVTIDSWINCDLCQKWRILTSEFKHLEEQDTFKCADIPGLTCSIVCDTLRFSSSSA